MTTARTIIKKAFQKAGILLKTELPSADEFSDALDTLNDLFASIVNETLMNSFQVTESFALTAAQAAYTMGPGGDFDTSRPVSILSAYVRVSDVDYPVTLISQSNFEGTVALKSVSSIPLFLVTDNNNPLTTLTLFPVPSDAWTLFIRSEKPYSTLTLDTDITLPPGWGLYLTYELSTLIAPEYNQQIDPRNVEIAREAKARIELAVAKARSMDAIPLGGGEFDIETGMGR